jgi:hypothetical protein
MKYSTIVTKDYARVKFGAGNSPLLVYILSSITANTCFCIFHQLISRSTSVNHADLDKQKLIKFTSKNRK